LQRESGDPCRRPEIDASLAALGVGAETVVVERGDVLRAKPEPDLFLTCSEWLGVSPEEATSSGTLSGTSLPPTGRRMLSVGLLSGGYGEDELTRASALSGSTGIRKSCGSRLDELGVFP